jgi:ParB/RepB/Spo0J family partition protein
MKSKSITYKEINPQRIKIIDGFNQRIDFGDIDELAAQIKEQGLLEAISVVPFTDEDGQESYLLINGERRYRAIKKLIEDGEEVAVKAEILANDINDGDLYAQQLMRNEGKKFNDIELGRLCKKLRELGYSNSEIAHKLGKNPGVITYAVQSLDYDPRIVDMMEKGEIGGTEVRRVYTAARKKYGDDWEAKANEQILGLKEKAVQEAGEKPVKVSIKDNDLYGDVKDTKTFVSGMKVLLSYIAHFERQSKAELEIDVNDMYEKLNKNSQLTLRELFEQAVEEAKNSVVA